MRPSAAHTGHIFEEGVWCRASCRVMVDICMDESVNYTRHHPESQDTAQIRHHSTQQSPCSLRQSTWQVFEPWATKELELIQWICLFTLTSCIVSLAPVQSANAPEYWAPGLLEHIFMNHDNDVKTAGIYFGSVVNCHIGGREGGAICWYKYNAETSLIVLSNKILNEPQWTKWATAKRSICKQSSCIISVNWPEEDALVLFICPVKWKLFVQDAKKPSWSDAQSISALFGPPWSHTAQHAVSECRSAEWIIDF